MLLTSSFNTATTYMLELCIYLGLHFCFWIFNWYQYVGSIIYNCFIYCMLFVMLWLLRATCPKWVWQCWRGNRKSIKLSLRFNGHFPGEPGLAGVYWSRGWWMWWWQLDYWSYKSCKAPVKSPPPIIQHPVFLQAGCPSCRPTNNVKALKGK